MHPTFAILIRRLLLVVASLCLLTALSCTRRQSLLNFTVVNNTRITITAIYVSPHDAESWQENVLAGHEIGPTDKLQIKFDPATKEESWDLKVVNNAGNYAEWRDLDLQRISKIMIRLREGTMLADVQ